MTLLERDIAGSGTVGVASLRISVGGEEPSDGGRASAPGGVVQRSIVGAVACIRVDTGMDERVDGGDVAELGGVAQLVLAFRR